MVKTDASNHMTAGFFFQYDDNGQQNPLDYLFCKTNFIKCNYKTYDKKFLAIIKSFVLWKSELENIEKPVQVIIDEENLQHFMFSKLLNRRQTRGSNFFSIFFFQNHLQTNFVEH